MQNLIEKLNHDLQFPKDLGKQTKELKWRMGAGQDNVGGGTVTIKTEVDCFFVSAADQGQPPAKKLKGSEVDNVREAKGSKSEDKVNILTSYHAMLQDQKVEKNNKGKDEPGMPFGTAVSSSSHSVKRARKLTFICG